MIFASSPLPKHSTATQAAVARLQDDHCPEVVAQLRGVGELAGRGQGSRAAAAQGGKRKDEGDSETAENKKINE